MEPGDHVIFRKDALLYGVLRIGVKTADHRFVCEPAHPSVPPHRRRAEIFFEEELEVFADPLVDQHALADQLAAREEYEQHLKERAEGKSNTSGSWSPPEKDQGPADFENGAASGEDGPSDPDDPDGMGAE